jgi:hypothetical protein
VSDLQGLVDAADPDELLLAVDRLAAAGEWDELAVLAQRCRQAVELGRQLWPVAAHIDYRLALKGPGDHAAAVLAPGAGRFALGPLTEVAAATHDWQALAAHIADQVSAASVAQERVLHGEAISGAGLEAAELPLWLAGWEPAYALPVYRDRSAAFPEPEVATRPLPAAERHTPRAPLAGDAPEAEPAAAMEDLAAVWAIQSAGHAEAVTVEGDAGAAAATVASRDGWPMQLSLAPLQPAEALALMQWTGASGGAYGARRGGAAGRFAAWWAAAALAGLDWPEPEQLGDFANELGRAVDRLHWYRWAPPVAEAGWVTRLAVADPVDGLAWALEAVDAYLPGDDPIAAAPDGDSDRRDSP